MYICTTQQLLGSIVVSVCMVVTLFSTTTSSFRVSSQSTTTIPKTRRSFISNAFYMTSQISDNNEDDVASLQSAASSTQQQPPSPKQQQQQQQPTAAIPFMKLSPTLAAYPNVPGNVGFDPFGFVQDIDDYIAYQEAEIKHARLAMLAVVGWPLSELCNGKLAESWDLPTILDIDDHRVPAVLNNNLGLVSPLFWGCCLGLAAAIDTYAILKSRDMSNPSYFPGNLNFDPFGWYPVDADGQLRMRLAEIKNGRLAMIAITGFAVQEYVSKVGVVDQTPLLFHPIFGV